MTINFQEGGYLYANGHPLTVNENVTFVNHPYVFGGGLDAYTARVELTFAATPWQDWFTVPAPAAIP